MLSAIALACAATTGIEVGWQPVEGGGVEYILQLDAAAIEILQGGEVFTSDIPSQIQDIRRLQISVGTRKLPRKLPKKAPPPIAAQTPREPGKFTPEEGSLPLVPPGDSGAKLAKGTAKKSGEGSGVMPAEAVSPLEALMNKKSPPSGSPEVPVPTASPEPALTPVPEEPRPWLPFVGALLGLFGSLGANVFLGWMWFGERNRYRHALARLAPREG